MAKPLSMSVVSDTKPFQKGIESGVIEPLEDAATALDDLGRDGQQAGDKLEGALKDAQRETEALEGKTDDLHKAIADGSKGSYRKMAQAADDGYDKASKAADDFKDEGKASAAELAGSFDGSMDSMAGAAQGMLGGLVATGGPVALASAAIALAGGAFYNNWKANAEATLQAVNDMYADMKESGKSFLSAQFVLDQVDKILNAEDGAVIKYEDAANQAKRLGFAVEEVLMAYAGDADAREKVVTATRNMYKADQDYLASAEAAAAQNAERTGEVSKRVNAEEDLLAIMKQQEDRQDSATNKAKTYTNVLTLQKNEYEKTYDTALRLQGDAIDSLSKMKTTADAIPSNVPVKVKVTTDTKKVPAQIQKDLDRKTFTIYVNPKTRGGQRAV